MWTTQISPSQSSLPQKKPHTWQDWPAVGSVIKTHFSDRLPFDSRWHSPMLGGWATSTWNSPLVGGNYSCPCEQVELCPGLEDELEKHGHQLWRRTAGGLNGKPCVYHVTTWRLGRYSNIGFHTSVVYVAYFLNMNKASVEIIFGFGNFCCVSIHVNNKNIVDLFIISCEVSTCPHMPSNLITLPSKYLPSQAITLPSRYLPSQAFTLWSNYLHSQHYFPHGFPARSTWCSGPQRGQWILAWSSTSWRHHLPREASCVRWATQPISSTSTTRGPGIQSSVEAWC